MKFSDAIGQDDVKAVLRRCADAGRVGHALLLSGPPGRGGLALALAYAAYLNCARRSGGDSCGQCPSCRKFAELAHPDLHFVFPTVTKKDPASGSSKAVQGLSDNYLPRWRETVASTGGYFDEAGWYDRLGIGNQQGVIPKRDADEVIRKLSFKSFEAEVKTVLVWLPEKMNVEAANTLLKILEEPWPGTLFLLVAADTRTMLPTVLSRVQSVDIPPIAPQPLEEYAMRLLSRPAPGGGRTAPGANPDDVQATAVAAPDDGAAAPGTNPGSGRELARAAARLSGGDAVALRSVLSAMTGEDAADEDFEDFAALMRFSYNDRHPELLEWADRLAETGRERQKRFLCASVGLLREAFLLGMGVPEVTALWGARREFCDRFAPYVHENNIGPLVEEFESALLHIARNGNPRIVLTHFALSVSKLIVRNR